MAARFSFGQNWQSYATHALDETRLQSARRDFAKLTRGIELRDQTFLDIGFGQGLALLLAAEQGARVLGIDVDPDCERALATTARHFSHLPLPRVQVISILDDAFVETQRARGGFAIIHSWCVLHHTGAMARAFQNAARLVRPGGYLIIAIYNRHWTSPVWHFIKRTYNFMPPRSQTVIRNLFSLPLALRAQMLGQDAASARGMEFEHDLRDWLGGYPYEYASAEQVTRFFAAQNFSLQRIIPVRGWTGCNQFVFARQGAADIE